MVWLKRFPYFYQVEFITRLNFYDFDGAELPRRCVFRLNLRLALFASAVEPYRRRHRFRYLSVQVARSPPADFDGRCRLDLLPSTSSEIDLSRRIQSEMPISSVNIKWNLSALETRFFKSVNFQEKPTLVVFRLFLKPRQIQPLAIRQHEL